MNKTKLLIGLSLIAVITFFVFISGINNDFLKCWDDHIYVVDNVLIQEFTWSNLRSIFSTYTLGNYHPLTLLLYAVEYSCFQMDPSGYHLVSIVLHVINCLLVCWLIYLMSGSLGVALVSGLLFAIHPLRVESVAWIADQKDLLCAFFFFMALILYLLFQAKRSYWYYWLGLFAFIFSVLSKALTITLPVLLVAIDYFKGRKFDRTFFLEKIPYFFVALGSGVLAIVARQSYQYQLQETAFTLFEKIFINIHRLVFYYLVRIFAPVRLVSLKPYVTGDVALPIPALILLIVIVFFIVFSLKHTKKIVMGSAFFFITLAPALFVVVLGYSADRFTYLSSIGISYIIAEGFVWLYHQKSKYQRLVKSSLLVALFVVASLCILATVRLGEIWQNCISLTSYFVRYYPDDPTVYVNRALAYEDNGEYDKALADYDKALTINPNYTEALVNRGNVHVLKKDLGVALADYAHALELDSMNAEAHFRRANVLYLEEKYEAALADYDKALEIDTTHAEIYLNRGNVYGRINDHKSAIEDYTKALDIDPLHIKAYYNRASAYFFLQDYQKAITDFTQVLMIDSTHIKARNSRAIAHFFMKEYGKAWEDIRQLEKQSYKVHPEFLKALYEASGQ